MKKKIIFLDGDGTLWYPKKTKRTIKPHWVYEHEDTRDNYLEHLELTPDIKKVLEKIKENNILLVVISANPKPAEIAVTEIKERINYFGLQDYFHEVRSSPGDDREGKGKVILEILEKLSLRKEEALMIGDSFYYDYMAAKNIGVDSFWIENSVSKLPEFLPKDLQENKINEVRDVFKF